MLETIQKHWVAKIALLLFLSISVWSLKMLIFGFSSEDEGYLFGATYGLMALLGGTYGILISQKWGGWSSVVGKVIILLSLGLLLQEFGQIIFSYYNIYRKVEVPYPSIADIGFFGAIPLYIFGIYQLAKAAGSKFSLNLLVSRPIVIIVPLVMLSISYFFFVRGVEVDRSNPLKVFLDFGYPFGQAIYISLAILTYTLSRKILGGIMKDKILFILGAFIAQYIADYNFLYQTSRETWVNGGYGDYLYFLAYFLMTLGILQLGIVIDKIKSAD